MLKAGLFGIVWKIFRYIILFFLVVAIWTYAISLVLFLSYGTIVNIETGGNIFMIIEDLRNSSLEVILSAFGDKIFSNIPFADFFNALFITKMSLEWNVLFTDIVITAFAGLVFYILARVNIVLQKILRSQLLFAIVTSFWTVASICSALVFITFLGGVFDDTKLYIAKCVILIVSVLFHAMFLFLGLKGIHLVRILLHILFSLLESIGNNLVLFLCSYYSLQFIATCRIDLYTATGYSLYGCFIILAVYSLIKNAIMSVVYSFRL